MRPGPGPRPTNLKRLEGNPGKRRLNENEPQPAAGAECPEWLSEEARREWESVAPELEMLGLLTRVDGQMLAVLCQALADFRRAVELRNTSDVLVKGERGLVKNPALQIARDAAQIIIRIAAEFGMTPSARGRLSVNPPEEEDSSGMLELIR